MAMQSYFAPPPTRSGSGVRRRLLLGVLALMVAWFAGLTRSTAGWLTLALIVVIGMLLVSYRAEGGRELARALLGYLSVALVVVLLSSGAAFREPQPIPAAKPAFRQAQRLDITDGCPEVARLRAWATCVLGKATAATNKHLSPTTTTTPRRKT